MYLKLQCKRQFNRLHRKTGLTTVNLRCGARLAALSLTVMRRRTSKITNPMTPIGPVPFVGRQSELTELKQHLALVSLVSLHGALGSGKTRLVSELAPGLGA